MRKHKLLTQILALTIAVATQTTAATWSGPDGTWSEPDTNSFDSTYNTNDPAVFSGSGPSAVNVDAGGVSPSSVSVTSGSYTFSGGSIGGTGTLSKSGAGTLTLSAANSYSGGTILSGGVLSVGGDSYLGDATGAITFAASSQLDVTANVTGARPVEIMTNVTATFATAQRTFSTTAPLSGAGTINFKMLNVGNSHYLTFLSTDNTFSGDVILNPGHPNAVKLQLTMNSLLDTPGTKISLRTSNGSRFIYGSAAVTPLSLDNRVLEFSGAGAFENQSSFPVLVNRNLQVLAGGTLRLVGSTGITDVFRGNITNGSSDVGLTINGWRRLSGTNTYSGITYLESGTLDMSGKHAIPTNSILRLKKNTTLRLLLDESGIVMLGNEIENTTQDTSPLMNVFNVHVGNNGGSTSNSTIVLGKVDFVDGGGNGPPGRLIATTGANGYRVQFGDVDMNTISTHTGSEANQGFRPTSAPITITGTIKQRNGNSGNTTANKFYIGGTISSNLITGTLADPNDYPSNSLAQPLQLVKGGSSEWILQGENTYSGMTTVNSGTLVIDAGSISQCLPDGTNLTITGSGVLQLNAGVREAVGSLTLGSTLQTDIGSYGHPSSSAQYTNDVYFAGTGVLYVGMPLPAMGTVLIIK